MKQIIYRFISVAGVIIMSMSMSMSIPTIALAGAEEETLSKKALDSKSTVQARLDALRGLSRVSKDAYVDALGVLIKGDDRFAVYAAESLRNAIIMVGGHTPSAMVAGAGKHDMTFVTNIKSILSEQVLHQSPEVRDVVVSYLVSLGDEATIDKVRAAEESGEIAADEALLYYMDAPPDIGNVELRRYAEGEKDELANKAIEVLSSDVTQQAYLRDRILTNTDVTVTRRSAALGGLAKYDEGFPNYATQTDVLDFALEVDQVPGTEQSGAALIADAVEQDISKNPGLREFYQRRFEEATTTLGKDLSDDKVQMIQKDIMLKLNPI